MFATFSLMINHSVTTPQSASVPLPTSLPQFQQLSAEYKSRRQLQELEDVELPRWVVHPYDIV